MTQTTAASASPLVLGLDIGGTSTRAVVVDVGTPGGTDGSGAGPRLGTRRGRGRAGGANLTSHPLEHALDAMRAALVAALDGLDPARVDAAVIGSAGTRNLHEPDVAARLAQLWREVGLRCGYTVEADSLVAFAAGTPSPDGTLLLAGTGSLAARVTGHRLVQIVDAHGWLLGDRGSGFWLGREAVRLALRALDEHRTPGPLGAAVIESLVGSFGATNPRDLVDEIIHSVHQRRPVALSELAPLVTGHAATDPEAARILSEAADHLVAAAAVVRPGSGGGDVSAGAADLTPIVFAGSLLASPTPLAVAVRERIATRWPGAAIQVAHDGAAGAAWLAAQALPGLDEHRAAALHAALFASPASGS